MRSEKMWVDLFKKINEADEFETSEKIINCKRGISKKLKMFKVLEFGNMLIIEIFIIFKDLNCYEYNCPEYWEFQNVWKMHF